MKKVIFSIVGSMLISFCVVQAQERSDTTGTASQERQQKNQKYEKSRQQSDRTRQESDRMRQESDRTRHQGDAQASQRQGDRNQYPNDYANEGMVVIDKSEMPPALKQQLQQKKYAGWENGTIYHNTSTGEYVIAPRAYRFDAQGKEIEMGNSPAYGNREGRQGRYSSGDRDAQSQNRTRESQTDQTQSQSQQGQRTQGQQDQPDQSSQNQSAQDQADNTDQADNAQSSQTQQSGDVDQAQQNQGQQSSQQPSTGYRTDRNNQSDANTESNTSTQSQAQSQYRTEDMVEVQAEQIPASLRRTLSESQYRGWEQNGTLYQDPSGNEYVLEMQSSNDASQPRIYRFDKNGQLKPGQNGTGNNDQ